MAKVTSKKKKVEEIEQNGLNFIKSYLNDQQTQDPDFNSLQIEFNSKKIEVKQYLDIQSKAVLIDTVVSASFVEENNIKIFKPIFMEFLYDFYLVKNYTDLNLSESDYTGNYDLLKQSGLLTIIKENIPSSELYFLDEMLDEALNEEFHVNKKQEIKEQQQELKKQSFGFVANKLITQITDFISSLTPEKMNEMVEMMGNLQNADILKGMMEGKIN